MAAKLRAAPRPPQRPRPRGDTKRAHSRRILVRMERSSRADQHARHRDADGESPQAALALSIEIFSRSTHSALTGRNCFIAWVKTPSRGPGGESIAAAGTSPERRTAIPRAVPR